MHNHPPLPGQAFIHPRVNYTRPSGSFNPHPRVTPNITSDSAFNTQSRTNDSLPRGAPPVLASCPSNECSPRTRLPPTPPTFSTITGIAALPSIHEHAITTPIDATLLEQLLRAHPNKHLAAYLIRSLRSGFRIGYTGPRHHLCAPNLHSAFLHPEIIDQALKKEISMNRVAGPFDEPCTLCSPPVFWIGSGSQRWPRVAPHFSSVGSTRL